MSANHLYLRTRCEAKCWQSIGRRGGSTGPSVILASSSEDSYSSPSLVRSIISTSDVGSGCKGTAAAASSAFASTEFEASGWVSSSLSPIRCLFDGVGGIDSGDGFRLPFSVVSGAEAEADIRVISRGSGIVAAPFRRQQSPHDVVRKPPPVRIP